MNDLIHKLSIKNDEIIAKIYIYLRKNLLLICILLTVACAAYGFELFNLNITIDQELAAVQNGAPIGRLQMGRWGMYFLNKFLFPFTVIPFVPLIVALIFQIAAILLIIHIFKIEGKLEQIIIGVIGISYPGLVYIYSFYDVNYGIGIGYFLIALSLYLYAYNIGFKKYWAVIPAVFAISIYQPFIPVLISIYLLYIIYYLGKDRFRTLKSLINISIIIISATILYYAIQELLLILYGVINSGYVEHFFDIGYLINNPISVLHRLSVLTYYVYSGDLTIYGIQVRGIGIILFLLALGILFNAVRSNMKLLNKAFLLVLLTIFMLMPFIGGILTKGEIPLRSLLGIPIILSGWALLGLTNHSSIYKSLVALLTVLCVFQFVSSSNHLFAASHLALEEDRLLGSRIIEKIGDAQSKSNSGNIHYLEMVGYLERPSTLLIPQIDTVGASFFGWDEGDSYRALDFLQTLGYYGLEPLPLDQRYSVVEFANSMANWPNPGSVKVTGDIVVVKFGPYSKIQISEICLSQKNRIQLQGLNFCP